MMVNVKNLIRQQENSQDTFICNLEDVVTDNEYNLGIHFLYKVTTTASFNPSIISFSIVPETSNFYNIWRCFEGNSIDYGNSITQTVDCFGYTMEYISDGAGNNSIPLTYSFDPVGVSLISEAKYDYSVSGLGYDLRLYPKNNGAISLDNVMAFKIHHKSPAYTPNTRSYYYACEFTIPDILKKLYSKSSMEVTNLVFPSGLASTNGAFTIKGTTNQTISKPINTSLSGNFSTNVITLKHAVSKTKATPGDVVEFDMIVKLFN